MRTLGLVWLAVVGVLGDLGSKLTSEDVALAAGVFPFLLCGFSDSSPRPGLAGGALVLSPFRLLWPCSCLVELWVT